MSTPEEALSAPLADPGPPTSLPVKGRLDNVTVTTASGRVFDLGRPSHPLLGARLFRFRVWRYMRARKREMSVSGR